MKMGRLIVVMFVVVMVFVWFVSSLVWVCLFRVRFVVMFVVVVVRLLSISVVCVVVFVLR